MNKTHWELRLQNFYLKRLSQITQEYGRDQLKRRSVVFSPHFDDETLGCGGLVIKKKQAGADVKIVFMTDGSKSHQSLIPAAELTAMREREGTCAGQALGVHKADVICLRYEEMKLATHMEAASGRVADLLREIEPEEVFIPYTGEPRQWSDDHQATTRIVYRAAAHYKGHLTIYEYPIWFWFSYPWVRLLSNGDRLSILRNSVKSRFGVRFLRDFNWSIDISDVRAQKLSALEQHRSQMFPLIPDVGWPTLGEVSNGEFLDCFFREREFFRSVGRLT